MVLKLELEFKGDLLVERMRKQASITDRACIVLWYIVSEFYTQYYGLLCNQRNSDNSNKRL